MKLSWKKLFLSTQFLTNFGRLHVELKKKVRVIRVTRIDSPSIYASYYVRSNSISAQTPRFCNSV